MEQDPIGKVQRDPSIPAPAVCSQCHLPMMPEWYFCPNCGHELRSSPLSTSVETQTWIYAFSIILPIMCFLMVSKWPGMKYYRSEDEKTKQIGTIAWVLLILSTVVTFWYAYVLTQQAIRSSENTINADMSI